MWKIGILLIGSLCQLICGLNACSTMENKEVIRLTSCDTALVDDHLQVQCYFHASSPVGSTVVGVITTFNTPRPFAHGHSDLQSQCLQMAYGRLKIIDPVEVQQYLQKSNKLNIPLLRMTPFTAFKDVDFNVRFQSDEIVGMVTYTPSCIGHKRQSVSTHGSSHLNISECVNEVSVLDAIATPLNSLPDGHGLMPQSKNLIPRFVGFMDKLWFKNYQGTVSSVVLTFQDQFSIPNLVKEAIVMLKERQVEALHLPSNLFETIGNDDLPPLPTLKTLDFTGCRLRSIEPLAFQSMTSLIHLNLAGNRFKYIPPALTPLINLEILNLSSNGIVNAAIETELPDDNSHTSLLIRFPRLRSLDLSTNDMDKLPPVDLNNEIDDHPRLLNLSGNKIEAWDEPMLHVGPTIRLDIDVTRNQISNVTTAMFTDFSKLNRVYLSGNPFICDWYHLNTFQEWLSRNATSNDHSSDPYQCASPKQCAGLDVTKVRLDPETAFCSSATSVTLSPFSRLWQQPGKQGIWTSTHFSMMLLWLTVLSVKSGCFTSG